MHIAAEIAQLFNFFFSPQGVQKKFVGNKAQLYQSFKNMVELRVDICAKGAISSQALCVDPRFQWVKNGAGKAKEKR